MPPHWGTGDEWPRLSVFLRVHARETGHHHPYGSSGDGGDDEQGEYDLANILAAKREMRRRKELKSGIAWGRIRAQVDKMGRALGINLDCYLREVFEVARQVAPELETREEAASLLFSSSLPPTEAVPTMRTRAKLRRILGDVHVHLLDRAHKAVRQIVDLLGQEELTEGLGVGGVGGEPQDTPPPSSMFGYNIKIGPPFQPPPDLIPPEKLLSPEKLLHLYKPKIEDQTLNYEDCVPDSNGAGDGVDKGPRQEVYDKSWVVAQMLGYYNDTSIVTELGNGTHTMLMSAKGDDELQNELFDLLGFERFELIQTLLQHRHDIKNAPPDKEKKIAQLLSGIDTTDLPGVMAVSGGGVGVGVAGQGKSAPLGQQVTVMNATEKQLLKQARKEERKLMRTAKQLEKDENADDFDPEKLRAKRETALLEASQAYLFNNKRGRVAAPEVRFPYVFDNHSKARMSPGFIASLKMVLPEGFTRTSDSTMEEVCIPTSDPAPPEVGGKFVPIADMDEIGQTVFRHCKTLNRIQTVVYPVAYHTNHNLLICAPTGAGKTNIALLTVVHQIRKHVEQGVIQMDKFKIVYIAPMKALACEMARNFQKRLEPLGLRVKELTGDMHLTKPEIMATHMIITTPEKWDVTTRKPGDTQLAQLVKLLIIDEVHLLHGDRGPVLETLVARTLRLVESQQSMIRIVGLSATLPNYIDVATFLRVNPYEGLFYFDGRFRPVPLGLTFVGVKGHNRFRVMEDMDRITFDKCLHFLQQGHQVMVFVHARNGTLRTAENLIKLAQEHGKTQDFMPEPGPDVARARKDFSRSKNKRLGELFDSGFGVHHAGLLRSDRNMVESAFSHGYIRVLVCTATLAWGVNLPAHAVIIKGTEIYDSKHGTMVDLGILDVLQIFGRAGRPQFDKSGHGTIITTHDKLVHYLSLLTNQYPIESSFINHLADNLNAEVALGTVTNIEEAVEWMSHTYLYVRMRKNPHVYGLQVKDVQQDSTLHTYRRMLLTTASRALDKARMLRFDESTGFLHVTDMGRVASQFYIKYDTVEVFNEYLKAAMNEADILAVVSQSSEFNQLKVRDEEMQELDSLHGMCEVAAAGGVENIHGKVNILLQSHISRIRPEGFSLVSDAHYVTENSVRITRALFEIVLHRGWPLMAGRLLTMAKMMELQMWHFESPLRQFHRLTQEIVDKIEGQRLTVEKLREMDHREIGKLLRHERIGREVKAAAYQFPLLAMTCFTQPITRTVLRVRLNITPEFTWNDKVHGGQENYWVWIEDPNNNHMYHHEQLTLTKKQVVRGEEVQLVCTIPIFEPLPTQYIVRALSDRWLNCESSCVIDFRNLILPERHPPHTDLLDLDPLPVTALDNPSLEVLYPFTHFNPIQTQIFHVLYHTDHNVLLGAPTGSGKTIAAEIAMFRVFREQPKAKVVYIAPLKALVRERVEDWTVRLGDKLGKNVVELTGDFTPDIKAIQAAHIIVTTPEKWDGISRSWQTRNYVREVTLIVIDEIHLLGEDRGPVLEVIVSRTNFITSHTGQKLRIIGLSTALANAWDLGSWLGIVGQVGLFNFRPSVRPVPLEVHISGFPGKHYCPRMATMNKPTFQAIKQYSPEKPVLVFVSSRRQTRLTAMDLMSFVVTEPNPKQWLRLPEYEMEQVISRVRDEHLRLYLSFGVGLHHAGLVERDRRVVEELFVNQKIQILITTATLAWGVNFPAHLVVVKGTEYYDGKTRRYVDFPITDVLQMMGRAGRPQFDDEGVAVILVHDQKKHFYKKFLYEPFPVESSLHGVLPDHLNAEVVAGTINTKQEALDYLTWTYFFRRILQNPSYYGLELEEGAERSDENINQFLSKTIDAALVTLHEAGCVVLDEDGRGLETTAQGRISSFYYISHLTIQMFTEKLRKDMTIEDLLELLTQAHEYAELPVRHNEDKMNGDLANSCPIEVSPYTLDSPHTKAFLLLQAHLSRLPLPCVDYATDTKLVLDQAIRILQALLDLCGCAGWLGVSLGVQVVIQMVTQGRWHTDSPFLTLPHINHDSLDGFSSFPSLPHLLEAMHRGRQGQGGDNGRGGGGDSDGYEVVATPLRSLLQDETHLQAVHRTLRHLPRIAVCVYVRGRKGSDDAYMDVRVDLGGGQNGGRGRGGGGVEVEAGEEYTLAVKLTRLNRTQDLRVHSQRFTKVKDEGWFLVLGEAETGDMIALKRVQGVRGNHPSTQFLSFNTPQTTGPAVLTLFLMSNAYLGLDQQYDIPLNIVPSTRQQPQEEEEQEEEEEEEEEDRCVKYLPPPDILPVMKSCIMENNNNNMKGSKEEEEEEEEEEKKIEENICEGREQRNKGERKKKRSNNNNK